MKRSLRNAGRSIVAVGALAVGSTGASMVVDVHNTGSGVGNSTFTAVHDYLGLGLGQEGQDVLDVAWSNSIPPGVGSNEDWLKSASYPYGIDLVQDNRPLGSDTQYIIDLLAVDGDNSGSVLSTGNVLDLLRIQPLVAEEKQFLDWDLDLPGATVPAHYSGVWNLSTQEALNLPRYDLGLFGDFTDSERQYGTLKLTPSNGPTIPEPATFGLEGLAAIAAGAMTGRKNHMSKKQRRGSW